ncbi:MAG: hypothetical protein ABH883_09095 [Candidatus Omnitrophota bacterium]
MREIKRAVVDLVVVFTVVLLAFGIVRGLSHIAAEKDSQPAVSGEQTPE